MISYIAFQVFLYVYKTHEQAAKSFVDIIIKLTNLRLLERPYLFYNF